MVSVGNSLFLLTVLGDTIYAFVARNQMQQKLFSSLRNLSRPPWEAGDLADG